MRHGGDRGSKASGKVANREVRTEVSQTAVSVLYSFSIGV